MQADWVGFGSQLTQFTAAVTGWQQLLPARNRRQFVTMVVTSGVASLLATNQEVGAITPQDSYQQWQYGYFGNLPFTNVGISFDYSQLSNLIDQSWWINANIGCTIDVIEGFGGIPPMNNYPSNPPVCETSWNFFYCQTSTPLQQLQVVPARQDRKGITLFNWPSVTQYRLVFGGPSGTVLFARVTGNVLTTFTELDIGDLVKQDIWITSTAPATVWPPIIELYG